MSELSSPVTPDMPAEDAASLRAQIRRLEREKRFFKEIAFASTLEEVFGSILEYVRSEWKFESFSVQLVNEQQDEIEFLQHYGQPLDAQLFDMLSQKIPLDDKASLAAKVALSRRPHYAMDTKLSEVEFIASSDAEVSRTQAIHDNLIIPVVLEKHTIALVHLLTTRHSLHLDDGTIKSIHTFIQGFARTIDDVRRKQELQDLKNRHEHFIHMLKRISATIELSELLDYMGEGINRIPGIDGYLINLIDADNSNLVCQKIQLPAELKLMERTYLHMKFPLGDDDIQTQALRQMACQLVNADNIAHCHKILQLRYERWGIHSLWIIPICSENKQPVGTCLAFSRSLDLSDKVCERLEAEVSLFSGAIQNSLYYSMLKTRESMIRDAEEERRKFLEFITRTNSLTKTEKILDLFCRQILNTFAFHVACAFLEEDKTLLLHKAIASGPEHQATVELLSRTLLAAPHTTEISDGAIGTVFTQNAPLYFFNVAEIKHLPMAPKDKAVCDIRDNPGTFFAVPIRHQDQPIGALFLASYETPVPLTEMQKNYIELLCNFLGTAVFNARLYETVEHQKSEIGTLNELLQDKVEELNILATTDKLTGLKNFSYFQEELSKRVDEYHRRSDDEHLSIVIFDIDHFKNFNDTHGHQAGNVAISDTAGRIRSQARTMDTPCRYGGEEFIVILPCCDLEGARHFGERVRQAIAARPVVFDGQEIPITISVGCACYESGESSSELIVRADEALYRAKTGGRNRVEVHEGSPAPV